MVSSPEGFLPLRGFRACLRPAIGFHVVLQAFAFALYVPIASLLANRLVRLSGEPVVSNFDLVGYMLSPAGLLFLFVVASIAVAVLLADFTGQTWISGLSLLGKRATVVSAMSLVLHRLPQLLVLGGRLFVRLALIALPFLLAAALTWHLLLRGQDINYYLAERPPEWRRAMWIAGLLAIGLTVAAGRQLARWIFAIPLIVLGGRTTREALAGSERLVGPHRLAITLRLLAWWIPIVAFTVACAAAGRFVSDLLLDRAGMDFRLVLPMVLVFATITSAFSLAISGIALGGHQFIVTRLFKEAIERSDGSERRHGLLRIPEASVRKYRRLAGTLIFAMLALFPVGLTASHAIASRLLDEEQVAVTAHRGAALVAPENTMTAFDAAIAAGADFIELDVQRSSDGVVVVVHDGDLMRLAGDPRKVGELTGEQLGAVDVGIRRGEEFTGQFVPTLEAVIDHVRGRVKLNVELKYNVPDPALVPAVVDLLRRKAFLDQAVITSLDAAALALVRELEPSLSTGRIITASVGNVSVIPDGFASLNAAQATPVLIRRLHARDRQVHVWTVNTAEAMLAMIERGADNLITDDPALARRVIRERAALGDSERLALRLRVLFDRPPREVSHPEAVAPL